MVHLYCRKLGKEEAAKALIANREQTASERAAAAEEDMARQRFGDDESFKSD